jgi:hypothetical protein
VTEIEVGTHAGLPWKNSPDIKPSREYKRCPWEWLPRPYAGRIMVPSKGRTAKDNNPPMKAILGMTLMIVPGPEGLYQVVRIELNAPVARGFRTKEQARGWIGRAVRGGVLPEGVVEVEPPAEKKK